MQGEYIACHKRALYLVVFELEIGSSMLGNPSSSAAERLDRFPGDPLLANTSFPDFQQTVEFVCGRTTLAVDLISIVGKEEVTVSVPGFLENEGPSQVADITTSFEYGNHLESSRRWDELGEQLGSALKSVLELNPGLKKVNIHGDSMGIPIAILAVEHLSNSLSKNALPNFNLICTRVPWMGDLRENGTKALNELLESEGFEGKVPKILASHSVLDDSTTPDDLRQIFGDAVSSNITAQQIMEFPGTIAIQSHEAPPKDRLHTEESLAYLCALRPDSDYE